MGSTIFKRARQPAVERGVWMPTGIAITINYSGIPAHHGLRVIPPNDELSDTSLQSLRDRDTSPP